MLVLVPYRAPKKEAYKEAKETRGGLRRRGASDTKSEDSNAHSSSEEEEEEEDESPVGGGKKRTASSSLEAKLPKRGKNPSRGVHHGYRQQPGVGSQGPAPGKIVSA